MNEKQITVTSPLLPDLEEFHALLKEIWDSKWITNNGSFHKQLEKELAEYLKVPYISLFTNGTLPLLTALQALRITGEVITTPYSFVATTHSIWWNGCKPVFVDVDPATGNMDPDKIEAAITNKTTAIMPVHVYGKPCDTKRIKEVADKYGLKVIYDAAHAFGVDIDIIKATGTPRSDVIVNDAKIAEKNGIDAIIFTAGVGEKGVLDRKHICSYLEILGVELDERLNEHAYIVPGLGDAGDRLYGTK